MSFTQDELQALNTILDQKLSIYIRELEHTFDRRIQGLSRDFEQRLADIQQELMRSISGIVDDQQSHAKEAVAHKPGDQQAHMTQELLHELEQKRIQQQQHDQDFLERSLAAQLLAFEQLIGQRQSLSDLSESSVYTDELRSNFDTIEVQTEIPWDELVDLVDRVLTERLSALQNSLQSSLKDTERYLGMQIHAIRTASLPGQRATHDEGFSPKLDDMQDVFRSIEQLERLIESMQVAMTTNSALISNRLYYHQQLPIERAHPGSNSQSFAQEDTPHQANSSPGE